MARGLSTLQQGILIELLDFVTENPRPLGLVPGAVPIRHLRGWFQDRTAADRAAFSRALRRLEQRGLVLRTNYGRGMPDSPGNVRLRGDQPAPVRSDHVILTDQGRAFAEAVNKKADELS
jgi:hypothetical protein